MVELTQFLTLRNKTGHDFHKLMMSAKVTPILQEIAAQEGLQLNQIWRLESGRIWVHERLEKLVRDWGRGWAFSNGFDPQKLSHARIEGDANE